jgi:hypothetical protein
VSDADTQALVDEGVLLRVPADRKAAQRAVSIARTHIAGAESSSDVDPTGSFTVAYDAARKAVVAHMRAHGLRVRSRFGAHLQTGRYAQAALMGRGIDAHVEAFVSMREVRNDTEYEDEIVATSDSAEALDHARAIVDLVEAELS